MKKKLAGLAVSMAVVLSAVGCGNSAGASKVEPNKEVNTEAAATPTTETKDDVTIAVAWNSMDVSTQVRMKYLEECLGPSLGINFIFSEVISDTSGLITFLENSYAAGADGILSSVTDGTEQLVSKSDELGMYSAVVSSKLYEEVANVPTFMGVTGIDLGKVADAYGELIDSQFDSKEPASFIIISGGSAMGVSSHNEATVSMLETLKQKYNLTYDRDAVELAKINATSPISTGRDDVKITIVPGFPNMDGYVSGVSGLLQTGEYDALISVYATVDTFTTAIDEVEKALGKNIKVLCQANFGENTKTAFETLDSTGNPTLDGAVIYPGTVNDAYGVALLYNGITGNSDAIKPEGSAIIMAPGPLVATNAEEYGMIAQLDTRDDMYVYSGDEVKEMIKAYNEEVNYDTLMKVTSEFSTEDILKRRGLK